MLSDRVLVVPELDEGRTVFARQGFNVIATANTRDRGMNEMSAALKRRFNFETVQPIGDIADELALVTRETGRALERANIPLRLPQDLAGLLVQIFHDLRSGQTAGGKAIEPLTSAMSTAEAVSVGFAACVQAHYFGAGEPRAEHVAQHLVGTALKDEPEDVRRLRAYLEHEVRGRRERVWKDLYEARALLA